MHPDAKPFQGFLRPGFKSFNKLSDLGGALSSRTIDQLGFPISTYKLWRERYFQPPSSVNRARIRNLIAASVKMSVFCASAHGSLQHRAVIGRGDGLFMRDD
jgi:hypothetical protein